jgi:hypothetical protein
MNSSRKLLQARRSAIRVAGIGLVAIAGLSAPMISAAPPLADITLNIQLVGPPPPRHEIAVEGIRPGPDYIWVDGYWDGQPGNYTWARGHWDRPPHANARWVAPRWDRGNDGRYHKVSGMWRNP